MRLHLPIQYTTPGADVIPAFIEKGNTPGMFNLWAANLDDSFIIMGGRKVGRALETGLSASRLIARYPEHTLALAGVRDSSD